MKAIAKLTTVVPPMTNATDGCPNTIAVIDVPKAERVIVSAKICPRRPSLRAASSAFRSIYAWWFCEFSAMERMRSAALGTT